MTREDTLAEAIAYELRRDILRGTLPPGAPIKERDNAEKQGVSRTPMREAIRILAKEGLVQLRPLRSPVVADPSLGEIIDQIRVLQALESLAAELACSEATEEDLTAITALKDKIERIYGEADTLDVFEIDMQFHAAIVTAAHNAALSQTHGAYMARLWRARYLSARRKKARARVLRQHDAILQALIARDSSKIKRETDAHLGDLILNIRDHFREIGESGAPTENDAAAD